MLGVEFRETFVNQINKVRTWERNNLFNTPGERLFLRSISGNTGLAIGLVVTYHIGKDAIIQTPPEVSQHLRNGLLYSHLLLDVTMLAGAVTMSIEGAFGKQNFMYRRLKQVETPRREIDPNARFQKIQLRQIEDIIELSEEYAASHNIDDPDLRKVTYIKNRALIYLLQSRRFTTALASWVISFAGSHDSNWVNELGEKYGVTDHVGLKRRTAERLRFVAQINMLYARGESVGKLIKD